MGHKMKAGISFKKVWFDDDLVEFEITTSDGVSLFCPKVYAGHSSPRLHFHKPGRGRLFITVNAQSDWRDFTMTKVASQAILYLTSEPEL
jgi:hypothetical protein